MILEIATALGMTYETRLSAPPPSHLLVVAPTIERLLADYDEHELKRDLAYARENGWDGIEARAINDDTFRLAAKVAGTYGPTGLRPDIAAGTDGAVSYVWELGSNYVYLDLGPGDAIHLYYDLAAAGRWEGVGKISEPRFAEALQVLKSAFWSLPRNSLITAQTKLVQTIVPTGGTSDTQLPPLSAA